jgi:hypothetical protein
MKTNCKALTKQGNPCKAPATEGGLCFFHANPDRARELGQMGGPQESAKDGRIHSAVTVEARIGAGNSGPSHSRRSVQHSTPALGQRLGAIVKLTAAGDTGDRTGGEAC